jgi:hypothetical protein
MSPPGPAGRPAMELWCGIALILFLAGLLTSWRANQLAQENHRLRDELWYCHTGAR